MKIIFFVSRFSKVGQEILGHIPLVQSIREGGDQGVPIMMSDDEITKKAFEEFAAVAVRSIAMRNAQMPKTTPLEFVNQ